ncbi:MAG: O-antigen ligase family protein [Bacilli bacterium]|nr:O-antigen ligase family protein [Bacilli bacterium]MDD4808778.1 O-antigen ligase family protein [Bacilli bacterium]
MKKNNLIKLLYIYILFQPFIDLATSLVTRFTGSYITLGVIIRGIFLFIITIYLLFYNKSKYRKLNIIYLLLITFYVIGYFITKEGIFNPEYLFSEIKYLFKHIYTPILFIGLLNVFESNKLDYNEINKLFIKVIIIYSVLIIVPIISFTTFESYQNGGNEGYIGWFYSANEIGSILTILFPYLFFNIFKKNTYKSGLILIPATLVMIFMGTKTSLLGLIIPLILFMIYFLYHRKENYHIPLITSIVLMVIVCFSIVYLPAINNIKQNVTKHNNSTSLVLSSRDTYLLDNTKIYEKADWDDKLFGIGITNRPDINNEKIKKAIEMDIYDILFKFGIIGTIILLLPYLYIFMIVLNYFNHKRKLQIDQLIYGYSVAIAILIAYMAGHVLGAPSVAIYLTISMVMLVKRLEISET